MLDITSLDLLVAASLSGIFAYLLAHVLVSRFKRMGMSGLDVHKPDKPETAEMGGVAVLVAAVAAAGILYLLVRSVSPIFVASLLGIALVGLIGVIDDLVSLRQRYKPFLVAGASIPIVLALFSRTSVNFPLIGSVPFGLLYPLVVVPLAVTTSANFSNMLAGFNGLEAGCAAIGLGTLTFLSVVKGELAGAEIGLLFFCGYLGFLVLNWYPAKIFPGDTGTLMAGAAIATVGLVSGLEFAAVVVSIPAASDFALKMLTRNPFTARKLLGDTRIRSDGTLAPPNYPSLSHAFMRLSSLTEKGLVKSLLGMEGAYALLAIALTFGFLL